MNEINDNADNDHVTAPDISIDENWSEDWAAAAEKASAKEPESAEPEEAESAVEAEEPEAEEPVEDTDEPEAEEDTEEKTEETDPEVQLEELAEKLGYSIDKGKVETRERVNFRRQYRAKVSELEERVKSADARYSQTIKEVQERYEPLVAMKQAAEKGDLDAVASGLGYGSFAELQIAHANGNTPENAKMRAMQGQVSQMQAQQAQAQQHAQQAQQLQQAEQAYQGHVSNTLAGYNETAQYARDPAFVQGVINVQRESIDTRTGRSTISAEQAASLIIDNLPGGRANNGAGSQSPNSEDVSDPSKIVETGRKKPPKTITRSSTSEASSSDKSAREDETDEEFFARWKAKM